MNDLGNPNTTLVYRSGGGWDRFEIYLSGYSIYTFYIDPKEWMPRAKGITVADTGIGRSFQKGFCTRFFVSTPKDLCELVRAYGLSDKKVKELLIERGWKL